VISWQHPEGTGDFAPQQLQAAGQISQGFSQIACHDNSVWGEMRHLARQTDKSVWVRDGHVQIGRDGKFDSRHGGSALEVVTMPDENNLSSHHSILPHWWASACS
jgi:hypothetical protein